MSLEINDFLGATDNSYVYSAGGEETDLKSFNRDEKIVLGGSVATVAGIVTAAYIGGVAGATATIKGGEQVAKGVAKKIIQQEGPCREVKLSL